MRAYMGDKWEGPVAIDVEHRPCTVELVDPDGNRTRLLQREPGLFSPPQPVVLERPGRYFVEVSARDGSQDVEQLAVIQSRTPR